MSYNGPMRVLLALLLLFSISLGQSLTVAVASSLRPPLVEIAKLFERSKGVKVRLSFGSSGSFFRQILGGAPYDVFLSANRRYPEELVRRGSAVKESLTVFARGRLVLFSLDREVGDLRVLLNAERVAVANPRYAPYGKAAVETLKSAGLYDELKGKLVYGSNVGQAFQFVVSGGAEYGFVSLSLAKAYGKGNYIVIPEDLHSHIKHVGVITEEGAKKEAAFEFIKFLKGRQAREIFRSFGFEVP